MEYVNKLGKEFRDLMVLMSGQNMNSSISPASFISTLRSINSQFNNRQQQDAHEFLMLMLNHLGVLESQCSCLIASQLTCLTCTHHAEMAVEPFTCLSLDIPSVSGRKSPDIVECLQNSIREEKVDWNCPLCKVVRVARKVWKLETIPNLLVLHLKRFQFAEGVYRKIKAEVQLPPTFQVEQEKFRISAVVNHHGLSMSSGHYTADVKVDRFNWMRCNDSKVRFSKGLKRSTTEAYLVFAEKC